MIKDEYAQDAAKNGRAQYEQSSLSMEMTSAISEDVHLQYYSE